MADPLMSDVPDWLTIGGIGYVAGWGMEDDEWLSSDIDDRVEQEIDNHWGGDAYPRTMTAQGYRPMPAHVNIDHWLELMIEGLHEEYSFEDMNEDWKPTPKVLEAAEELRLALLDDFPVSLTEPCEVKAVVDVEKWMRVQTIFDPHETASRPVVPGDYREGAATWAELFEEGSQG